MNRNWMMKKMMNEKIYTLERTKMMKEKKTGKQMEKMEKKRKMR
jgi:hypothetical protein